jgi:epoxyqueuosine reductase
MFSIKEVALSVGFDACGIAKAKALIEDAAFLKNWFSEGYQAEMTYLERNFEKRINPTVLVPDCKSVVVVLMNYFPEHKQLPTAPQIAKYAYSAIDYHTVLKAKLVELEHKICNFYGSNSVSQTHQHLFVDSAPVLERRWAQRAGLGWIGKNTQLIHAGLGSYTFIGVLMLNIETEYDTAISLRCGTCTKCIDACPTHALSENMLDSRRCISYLTIESKNEIPDEYREKLSNCAFGCDICADVCPWNAKWGKPNFHSELSPMPEILHYDFNSWQGLSEESFNTSFRQSALNRAGVIKLKQNLKYLKK